MTSANVEPIAEQLEAGVLERTSYERDFYAWALEQAALIRNGSFKELDRKNVAEEIESLARREFDKLVSFYGLILLHMLKWEHQPNFRGQSWALSIALHREHASRVLEENPGLKPRLDEALRKAYRVARIEALRETGLHTSTFPQDCPYTRDEMLTRPYALD